MRATLSASVYRLIGLTFLAGHRTLELACGRGRVLCYVDRIDPPAANNPPTPRLT